jgi:parallel beta-helix repeat protein
MWRRYGPCVRPVGETVTRRRLPRLVLAVAAVCALVLAPAIAFASAPPTPGKHPAPGRHGPVASGRHYGLAPTAPTPICGQPILNSPYSYNAVGGTTPVTFSTSGTPAGLPTFGAAGTDFPNDTSVVVIPPHNLSSEGFNYDNDNTVYFFEPGTFVLQGGIQTGVNSAYIGGYTTGAGKAIIDGLNGGTATGLGANGFGASKAGTLNADQTYEYLTLQNFGSNKNDSVIGDEAGAEWDQGNTYKYNTIGPNEYGYVGTGVPPSHSTFTTPGLSAGYAIDGSSNTTIQYNCLDHNGQGAFNMSGLGLNVSNNEISYNGLAIYPDTGGSGGSPNACGCSGGGKMGYTLNATVDNNYVHDNYNAGIWLDFDHSGADISGNYLSSNWGAGIAYEASYNANITDNTLVGNEWASNGPWPHGYNGGLCGNTDCAVGGGAQGGFYGFPEATISIANSGGNPNLDAVPVPNTIPVTGCPTNCVVHSRYVGQLLVENNVLIDNFGGVALFTDTDRYPGNINVDSACGFPMAPFTQNFTNPTYYLQTDSVQTASSDATITGNAVTTPAGTTGICNPNGSDAGGVVTPPGTGWAVYDMNTTQFLGTVATVTSANAFTLSGSPGDRAGARLSVSAYGGCGPADYAGGAHGVQSGQPAAFYWDNCIWGTHDVTVSGNTFSMDAGAVTGCTVAAACGYNQNEAFNAGVPLFMQFFDAYDPLTIRAAAGIGNVFSGNTYIWRGGGPGAWSFNGPTFGSQISQAGWLAAPQSQDAGSTFGTVPPPNCFGVMFNSMLRYKCGGHRRPGG